MINDQILLAHGSGGVLTNKLVEETILKYLQNEILDNLGDSAVLNIFKEKICFTTDSYVINPIFFPGGDIGSLSVNGTINDLSVSGAKPIFLSLSFIIEEGFKINEFEKILKSISKSCKKAKVKIVTGDTKVVEKGHGDKIFINTAGIGTFNYHKNLSYNCIKEGDCIILNGSIAEHGVAILSKRENFNIETGILSDSKPLNNVISKLLKISENIHCMRDATRGGLAGILLELAKQSKYTFKVYEKNIPVKKEVASFCEILGLDPLYIANEGKFVIFSSKNDAEKILKTLHKLGEKDAKIIGEVKEKSNGRVVLETLVGGKRELDHYPGDIVPRIC